MNSKIIIVLFCILMSGLILNHQVTAQYIMRNSVLSNGGISINSESNQIVSTVGQSVIGVIQNESYINKVGFWYQAYAIYTSVEQIPDILPTKFRLEQNFPNPFNPTTHIIFTIPKPSHVILKVFDTLGREVATLMDEEKQAGEYHILFNAGGLSTGVYLYRLEAGDYTETRKLILEK